MALAVPGFLDTRLARRIGVVAVGAAATVGAYLWLLYHSGSGRPGVSSYLRGPYLAWHVVAVVVILGLGAIWAGWLGFPLLGALVESSALVASWSITAATDRTSNSAWPIGAVLIGWVCLGGSLLVGSLVAQLRITVTQRAVQRRYDQAAARALAVDELAARRAAEEAAKRLAQRASHDAAMARAAEVARRFEQERAVRAADKARRVKVVTVLARSTRKAPSRAVPFVGDSAAGDR
jgi:hypothetical protein